MMFPNKTACTLAAARAVFPQLANHRLQTVAEYLNVTSREQHRALGDAMATAKILIHILNRHDVAV
jgi:DNA polymerase III epsilon subunit-like protein